MENERTRTATVCSRCGRDGITTEMFARVYWDVGEQKHKIDEVLEGYDTCSDPDCEDAQQNGSAHIEVELDAEGKRKAGFLVLRSTAGSTRLKSEPVCFTESIEEAGEFLADNRYGYARESLSIVIREADGTYTGHQNGEDFKS